MAGRPSPWAFLLNSVFIFGSIIFISYLLATALSNFEVMLDSPEDIQIQVDESRCLPSNHTEYESICVTVDSVNLSVTEDGEVNPEVEHSIMREEAAG